MTDHLETLILTEANRQGIQPNADAMRQAAICLAGASLTSQGLISLPNVGTISPADLVGDLRNRMPESFTAISDDDAPAKFTEHSGLTARYQVEIAANRSRPRFTESDLARYSGMTRAHIEERLRADQGKHR